MAQSHVWCDTLRLATVAPPAQFHETQLHQDSEYDQRVGAGWGGKHGSGSNTPMVWWPGELCPKALGAGFPLLGRSVLLGLQRGYHTRRYSISADKE